MVSARCHSTQEATYARYEIEEMVHFVVEFAEHCDSGSVVDKRTYRNSSAGGARPDCMCCRVEFDGNLHGGQHR